MPFVIVATITFYAAFLVSPCVISFSIYNMLFRRLLVDAFSQAINFFHWDSMSRTFSSLLSKHFLSLHIPSTLAALVWAATYSSLFCALVDVSAMWAANRLSQSFSYSVLGPFLRVGNVYFNLRPFFGRPFFTLNP